MHQGVGGAVRSGSKMVPMLARVLGNSRHTGKGASTNCHCSSSLGQGMGGAVPREVEDHGIVHLLQR